jgi:hypothetical protein
MCGLAGFMTRVSRPPPPPGFPTVRVFPAAPARIALDRLDERLAGEV